MVKIREKLEFKNPIIDILAAVVLGILMFVIYEKAQLKVLVFIVPLIVLFIILYDKKCFCIVCAFFIFGIISSISFYNFSENREDVFNVRIEKSYKDYYMASAKGRKFYLYSDVKLNEDEKVVFKGKYKEDVDLEKGIVGHLFLKQSIKTEKDFTTKLRAISKNYYYDMSERIGDGKAAIATALVFGEKEFIEKDTKNDFKNIGILHLICISGFHIAFIYSIVRKFLPKSICIIITFIYLMLTAFTVSGLRAFYMLLILEGSKISNKNYSNINSLALAALLLLFVKPFYIFDIGFLLSVFATLGIFLFNDIFKRLLYFLPNFINTSISLSICAQIFVYPIMILYFGTFSMNFILGSLILTPYVLVVLPFGILTLILFCINVNIPFIDSIARALFNFFEAIVEYLKFYSVDSYYVEKYYAVIYILILFLFYIIYKGFIKIDYYKISYFLVFSIFIYEINVFPTVYIFQKEFNKAIVVESLFKKTAYTNSKSSYFIDELKKEYSINNVENLKGDYLIDFGKGVKIIIKPNIDDSFIMLRKKNYDIIDMLNRDENAIFIKNRIYINERGK